jgi:hypothetical protein
MVGIVLMSISSPFALTGLEILDMQTPLLVVLDRMPNGIRGDEEDDSDDQKTD